MSLSPFYDIHYAGGNWGKTTKDAVRDSQSEGWRTLAVARKRARFWCCDYCSLHPTSTSPVLLTSGLVGNPWFRNAGFML